MRAFVIVITFALITVPASAGAEAPIVFASGNDTSDYTPGTKFRDCPECPLMVVVPAGKFEMGSVYGARWEQPVHEVTIPAGLAVGVYEVSQREWKALMKHNKSAVLGDELPVGGVDWHTAALFARELRRKTGRDYRLLSEAEWEYVARAGTKTNFWFGDKYDRPLIKDAMELRPVGQSRANPFGLHNVHGNITEWVADCWNGDYSGAPSDGSARKDGDCGWRIYRDSSWGRPPYSFNRTRNYGHIGNPMNGLRVAVEVASR